MDGGMTNNTTKERGESRRSGKANKQEAC